MLIISAKIDMEFNPDSRELVSRRHLDSFGDILFDSYILGVSYSLVSRQRHDSAAIIKTR